MTGRQMRRPASGWVTAAAGIALALAVLSAYRAVTQSLVYDEAFSYLAFLSGSPRVILAEYTANNHVLFSLAAKASTGLLGVSPFALRLPSVLASVMFLGSIVWLTARGMFGVGVLSLVAAAAVMANPLMLDFFAAARGYGAALALFTVALTLLWRAMAAPPGSSIGPWAVASLAIGLSVAANLTFAVPAVALLSVATAIDVHRGGCLHHRSRGAYVGQIMTSAVLPGAAAAGLVLARPLSGARMEHFFYGAASFRQTALSLVSGSFDHDRSPWPADPDVIAANGTLVGLAILAAAIVVLTAALAVRAWVLLGRNHATAADAGVALVGGTLVVSLALLVTGHWLTGLPYPFGRTGLYLIVLVTAGAGGSAAVLQAGGVAARATASLLFFVLLASGVGYAAEGTASYFYHWRYDAGTDEIVRRLAMRTEGGGPVRVAVGEVFVPSAEFYRRLCRMTAAEFESDDWFDHPGDFDFFIVSPASAALLEQVARPVYEHPVSHAVLMENRRRAVAPTPAASSVRDRRAGAGAGGTPIAPLRGCS